MNNKKKYISFKLAFGVLVISTVILAFSNKDKTESIISGFSALAIGVIYLYFKISDIIEERHKKARKIHLDK